MTVKIDVKSNIKSFTKNLDAFARKASSKCHQVNFK